MRIRNLLRCSVSEKRLKYLTIASSTSRCQNIPKYQTMCRCRCFQIKFRKSPQLFHYHKPRREIVFHHYLLCLKSDIYLPMSFINCVKITVLFLTEACYPCVVYHRKGRVLPGPCLSCYLVSSPGEVGIEYRFQIFEN